MASIEKRGKRHLVKWRDPPNHGGGHRTKSCPDRATAEEVQRQVERDYALGLRWAPGEAPEAPMIEAARDAFLKFRGARKRANTLVNDEVAIAQFVDFLRERSPRSRGFRISELSNTSLQQFDLWQRGRVTRDATIGPRTANARVLAVRRWWAWMMSQDAYRVHLQAPPEARVLDLPSPAWAPPHAPTWDEMDRAITASDDDWTKDIAIVLRYTGLRQGQAMALEWRDFDLDAGLLTVRPELGKTKQERAGRVVPISPHLVRWLAGRGVRRGLVIAPHKQQRKATCWDMEWGWLRGLVRLAVWDGHPAHAYRYGFTSGLKALGADVEAVEHLVGHAVPGARSSYLDPRWALRLREAVELVPEVGAGANNVQAMRRDG